MDPFNIENALNTCYIDSVLMSLFFSPSLLDRLLYKDCKNVMGIYLQELINEKFVKNIRDRKSVLAGEIDTIRAICFESGWRNNIANEYSEQQDVTEFYSFLVSFSLL